MKSFTACFFSRILPAACLVFLLQSCSKEKEEDHKLTQDYTGTLRFEYTRSFPAFSVIIDMEIDLYKSGDMIISQPSGEHYDATNEVSGTVKIRETGDVIITSLSGQYKVIDGTPYVVINANTLIDGTMTVWGWDDEHGWVLPTDIPFSLENPVGSPMNFEFSKAIFEDFIGTTAPAYQGTVTAKWTIGLMPAPPL